MYLFYVREGLFAIMPQCKCQHEEMMRICISLGYFKNQQVSVTPTFSEEGDFHFGVKGWCPQFLL